MVSVFLSHSSKDKEFVQELADFVERDRDIRVWRDDREITPDQNIVGKIADGLGSDFILLILSPNSVGSEWVEEEWTDAFWEQTNNGKTKLLGVLYQECKIPRLLQNKKYFDLRTNHPEGFRQIRTFLLGQRPAPRHVNHLPVRPPVFIGREKELAHLRDRLKQPGTLVHLCEMPGQGKTTFALEFAHRHQRDFEAVYWLPCQGGSLASIASELQRLLKLKVEGDLPEIVRELKSFCADRQCLLILDNVDGESPGDLIPGGVASVLVTTRWTNLHFLSCRDPVKLPLFTDEQCMELFSGQLGPNLVVQYEAECKQLFARLGHLPIAVSVSASLIRYDVRYTIADFASILPGDVTALISEAIGALDPEPRKLLTAMSACAPEGFRLDLAPEIASVDETVALAALQVLVERSLAEEVDRPHRRYRLHALVREVAEGRALGERHADILRRRYKNWEVNWRRCQDELPDFRIAFEWATAKTVESGIMDREFWELARCGFRLTQRVGRLAESFEICQKMRLLAKESNNLTVLQWSLGNLAGVLQVWGRLEETLALYKQQEAISLELGNKNALQASLGGQAAVMQALGRLDDALALHMLEEAICLELGNKEGLQRSYGNRASVRRVQGRSKEALALYRQQEMLCLELGGKDSLQACFGNQASFILQMLGPLQDALALLQKQEAICLELNNKGNLGYCYWTWGWLERASGNVAAEQQRLSAALAIFERLKMPRERDAVAAELARWCNPANDRYVLE